MPCLWKCHPFFLPEDSCQAIQEYLNSSWNREDDSIELTVTVKEARGSEEELEKVVRAEVKQLSTHLTAYKRPVNITITKESLPRTATNKVKRKEVKALVQV